LINFNTSGRSNPHPERAVRCRPLPLHLPRHHGLQGAAGGDNRHQEPQQICQVSLDYDKVIIASSLFIDSARKQDSFTEENIRFTLQVEQL
jgi:hypothetical protein